MILGQKDQGVALYRLWSASQVSYLNIVGAVKKTSTKTFDRIDIEVLVVLLGVDFPRYWGLSLRKGKCTGHLECPSLVV